MKAYPLLRKRLWEELYLPITDWRQFARDLIAAIQGNNSCPYGLKPAPLKVKEVWVDIFDYTDYSSHYDDNDKLSRLKHEYVVYRLELVIEDPYKLTSFIESLPYRAEIWETYDEKEGRDETDVEKELPDTFGKFVKECERLGINKMYKYTGKNSNPPYII